MKWVEVGLPLLFIVFVSGLRKTKFQAFEYGTHNVRQDSSVGIVYTKHVIELLGQK